MDRVTNSRDSHKKRKIPARDFFRKQEFFSFKKLRIDSVTQIGDFVTRKNLLSGGQKMRSPFVFSLMRRTPESLSRALSNNFYSTS